MDATLLTSLLIVLAVVSVVALVVAVAAYRAAGRGRRAAKASPLPTDVVGLRREVEALRTETAEAIRHLGVVRYDAFDDMGGRLSWSVALLDPRGDGVVLTSIAGRSEARTYVKTMAGWASEQTLSPEEDEAVKLARGS